MKTSHLQLESLMCDFCTEVVERAVQSLPGVRQCNVNLAEKQATIEYDPQRTNLEIIQKALASAGYTAQPLNEQVK